MLGSLTKQPNDRVTFAVDFNDWLDEVQDAIGIVGAESDDPELAVLNVSHADGVVTIWIEQGVHGGSYKVTVTMQSLAGRVIENEVRIRVRER